MAKKKSSTTTTTNQSKQEEQIQPQTVDHPVPAMDDQSEKLQSLKSLNSILLKETHERRLQVDALTRTNKDLESQLNRVLTAKNVADTDFTRAMDEKAALELEKSLTSRAMGDQINEIRLQLDKMTAERDEVGKEFADLKLEMEKAKSDGEFEIGVLKNKLDELTAAVEKERGVSCRVVSQRDELKDKLEVQTKEVSVLREKVVDTEAVERKMADDSRKLKTCYEGSLRKNQDMVSAMQTLTKEKDSINKKLADSVTSNSDLKKEIEDCMRAKEGIEEERNRQAAEIQVLENKVDVLIGSVNGLKEIEEELNKKISELEMTYSEGVESRKQMLAEFNILQEQKLEFEKKTVALLEEKMFCMRSLEALEKKLDDQKQHIGCLVRDKSDIEEDRNIQVMKIKELEKQLADLSEVVMTLRDVESVLNTEVSEMRKSNAEVVESRDRILIESTDLKQKNVECARQIETLLEEKSINLRSLELLENKLEDQKLHVEALVREKSEVEEESKMHAMKIKELENEDSELSEIVSMLRNVEMGLNSKVSELEKCYAEGVESRKHLLSKITVLQEIKEESEKKIGALLEENRWSAQTLEMLEKKVEEQKQHIEIVVREKSGMEDMQFCLKKKIVELQRELGQVKDTVVTLQEICVNQEEGKKKLLFDISQYTLHIGQLTNESDDAVKGLKMEKDHVTTLLFRLSEIEKKLEESSKQIEQLKMENVKVAEIKEDVEHHCEILTGQNLLLQEKLIDVQTKFKSKCDILKWVFSMLSNTAELVITFSGRMNGKDDDLLSSKQMFEKEEVNPYMVELERIEDAFKNKEAKVEELERQLEFLQNSMVEVNKKKNFWTLFSSATTLFAAASVAYVTRGN